MCHYRVFIKEIVNGFCEKGATLFSLTPTRHCEEPTFFCLCEERSDEAIPVWTMRLPRTFQVLAITFFCLSL